MHDVAGLRVFSNKSFDLISLERFCLSFEFVLFLFPCVAEKKMDPPVRTQMIMAPNKEDWANNPWYSSPAVHMGKGAFLGIKVVAVKLTRGDKGRKGIEHEFVFTSARRTLHNRTQRQMGLVILQHLAGIEVKDLDDVFDIM